MWLCEPTCISFVLCELEGSSFALHEPECVSFVLCEAAWHSGAF